MAKPKSNMEIWAENEIRIACERERGGAPEGEWEFLIEFPYVPETYKVFCDKCLTDRKNGDYDTVAILYVEDRYGETWDIYRYFKETEDDWEEICEGDWRKRVQLHQERERRETEGNEL